MLKEQLARPTSWLLLPPVPPRVFGGGGAAGAGGHAVFTSKARHI